MLMNRSGLEPQPMVKGSNELVGKRLYVLRPVETQDFVEDDG